MQCLKKSIYNYYYKLHFSGPFLILFISLHGIYLNNNHQYTCTILIIKLLPNRNYCTSSVTL